MCSLVFYNSSNTDKYPYIYLPSYYSKPVYEVTNVLQNVSSFVLQKNVYVRVKNKNILWRTIPLMLCYTAPPVEGIPRPDGSEMHCCVLSSRHSCHHSIAYYVSRSSCDLRHPPAVRVFF